MALEILSAQHSNSIQVANPLEAEQNRDLLSEEMKTNSAFSDPLDNFQVVEGLEKAYTPVDGNSLTAPDILGTSNVLNSTTKTSDGSTWTEGVLIADVDPLLSSTLVDQTTSNFAAARSTSIDSRKTLSASEIILSNGGKGNQVWGDGVIASAKKADGSVGVISYRKEGLAVLGGRYDTQLDYIAQVGKSEQLIIDFANSVSQVQLELGLMSSSEWNNQAETGYWTAYDAAGKVAAKGILDPKAGSQVGKAQYLFSLESPQTFSKLVIEATPYGNGAGSDTTANNSDFNLRAITFTPAEVDTTSKPPAEEPSLPEPGPEPPAEPESPTDQTPEPEPPSEPPADLGIEPMPLPPGTSLWSDVSTWGNKQIRDGDPVTITKGMTVLLDTDTVNLAGVIIDGGKLIFAEEFTDKNSNSELDFTADWLLVRNGGQLEIGTVDDAYEANATITLVGADEDVMNMGMGGRFIIASGAAADGAESTISMHGIDGKKVSWTQLSAHANKGDKVISLAKAVDWEVGDEIVIAPSGFDAEEAEKRKIVAVNGNEVTLDQALSYDHFGKIDMVDGQPLDMRAEVGLLSRNIDIQGAEDSLDSEFGAHMMFMDGSSAQISGIEIRRGGQIRKKARYPVHWHLGGDHSGDYIKDSSIYNSFQRGVVLHGVSNVEVKSNVIYNVFGHGYVFSEDGNEEDNRFENNLGLLVKNRESSSDFSFFDSGQQGSSSQAEHRSAVFWGRNYYNPMVGNHAAGTLDGNGFHIDLAAISRKNKVFKNSTAPIIFNGNTAHSNGRDRLNLSNYSPIATGNGLMIANLRSKPSSDIVFKNFTSYKNVISGAWIEEDRHVLQGAMLADNSSGVIIGSGTIENTILTHQSSNKIGGVYGVDRGLVLDGGIHILLGRNEVDVQDIRFVNTVGPAVHIERETQIQEGSTFNGIEYIGNKPTPLYWKGKDNTNPGAIIDVDGSFLNTGIPSKISGPHALGIDKKFFDDSLNAYVVPLD